tara:strand:- start:6793 stop:7743 length:951 start_codon:yes stop_codon:yes gene_type:complete
MRKGNKMLKKQNSIFKQFRRNLRLYIMEKKKMRKKKLKNRNPEDVEVFICESCNYECRHRGNYNKHLRSKKHLMLKESKTEEKVEKMEDNIFYCRCGKSYKHRQSLYSHEQRCKFILDEGEEDKGLKEDKPSYDDLIKIIGNLIPKIGNNNNNVTNNNINIQVLLSENCGDAMTIQNFADKLTLTIEDLLKERKMIGNVGNIVVENLKPIPLLKRPIHCTDVGNSTWMVNDAQDGWKEDDGKKLIQETGFGITKKFQVLWDNAYPDWKNNPVQQQHYTSLVEQLSMEHTESDIENILHQLGSKCTLTVKEIEESLK